MALLLRKACEPILSEADLDAYFADIDAQTKYLCLYTPCGKRFAIIHGVTFSRLHPTQAEIEYACDLLRDWCIRNQMVIDDYVDAFTILQRMEKPDTDLKAFDADIHITNHETYEWDELRLRRISKTTPKGIEIIYRNHRYCLDRDLQVISVNFRHFENVAQGTRPKLPCKIDVPKKILAAASARLEELELYKDAEHRANKILHALNTCTS